MLDEYQKITRDNTNRVCLLVAIVYQFLIRFSIRRSKGLWICRRSSHLSCNGIERISLVDLSGRNSKEMKSLISTESFASENSGSLQAMERNWKQRKFCVLRLSDMCQIRINNAKKFIIRSMIWTWNQMKCSYYNQQMCLILSYQYQEIHHSIHEHEIKWSVYIIISKCA